MIDINELRRLALDGDLAAMQEIILRLEAAEKSDAESIAMYRKARDERDALRAALRHEADCAEAAKAEIEALRAKIAKMEQQELARLVTPTAYRWRYRGAIKWQYGELTEEYARLAKEHNHEVQPLYALPGAQPAPSFADAYQGAMEDVAIWKKRALEAEDLNRKFVAEVNGPAYMGEPAQPALSQSAQGIKDDIISDLQTQFDTEGIAEYDSGDALIRLSDAIAAVEDNFALAQPAPKAVAYLDLGTGGYMDIGTDLTDEALAALPKGRHVLGIVGTYGVDGYVPAQPAPKGVDGWREGVESAARLIDQKAELYAIRFGRDDIGGLSFGQGPHAKIKMDHYTSMIELADEVRATLAAAPKPEGE